MSSKSSPEPDGYSESRYLLSKRTVDDRALHQGVVAQLKKQLKNPAQGSRAASGTARPRVLEIGCGVGTMLKRLVDWGLLCDAEYTFVELDGELLQRAKTELLREANVSECSEGLVMRHASGEVLIHFVPGDALVFATQPENLGKFDFLLANAVLDLMALEPALNTLWKCLVAEGLYWFTINFDGETILLPESAYDTEVMATYHRTMDERLRDGQPAGDSRTGRHLLSLLPKTGASLLAAGSSDWVVFPQGKQYPDDEQYFLRHILHTIDTALRGATPLDAARFDAWVNERSSQIDRNELSYIAHQIDVMGRSPRA